MQDFMYGNIKKQEVEPEPYTLYNKEQAPESLDSRKKLMRDMEYFRSLYPERVKELQLVVEEICDDVDYEDSPMYDEYPDRVFVEQLFHKVLDKAPEKTQETASEKIQEKAPEIESQTDKRERVETYELGKAVAEDFIPRMPYGPENTLQARAADRGTYRTWEMNEALLEAKQLTNNWGPPPPPRPWGPPPPPPRPWGPPPPPPHPWGPPPPPRPWGPPPPPPHPWGPPGPPPGPCGPSSVCPPPRPWGPPPPPPPHPWGRRDMDDIIRLLLFGEMQKRRCNGRNCR